MRAPKLAYQLDWARYAAVWQIIAGVWAAVAILSGGGRGRPLGAGTSGILLILCAIAIVSGVGVLRGSARARNIALGIQFAQLVGFSMGYLVYEFILGPFVGIVVLPDIFVGVRGLVAGSFRLYATSTWQAPGMQINLLTIPAMLALVAPPPVRASGTAVGPAAATGGGGYEVGAPLGGRES